jgi:Mor family transcriptional regulator
VTEARVAAGRRRRDGFESMSKSAACSLAAQVVRVIWGFGGREFYFPFLAKTLGIRIPG